MIRYSDNLADVKARQLEGFFVGWPSSPSPQTHLRILRQSDHVVIAIDTGTDRIIGFVTAISDGILSACIPLLEVLPTHQKQGIGTELMRRMLDKLRNLYMIDLTSDPDLRPFYTRLGMKPSSGMMIRNYSNPSGHDPAR